MKLILNIKFYINGLLNLNINAKIICYASTINDLYTNSNNVVKEINDWFDNHFLELNLTKSKYIHFNINY